jgi:hypothetical protein
MTDYFVELWQGQPAMRLAGIVVGAHVGWARVRVAGHRCQRARGQARALVSSADSGSNWDARCFAREGLIAYVQRPYPEALPRWRGELSRHGDTPDVAAQPATPPGQHSPAAEDGSTRAIDTPRQRTASAS